MTIRRKINKSEIMRNRDTSVRGTPLAYNASQQARYSAALQDLVLEMTRETKKQIKKLFDGELADDYFDQQAQAAAMDESLSVKATKVIDKLRERFQALFVAKAVALSATMVKQTKKTSETALRASLKKLSGGLTLKTSVVPKGMENVSKAIINENVSLITSLPEQYYTNVSGAVMRYISAPDGETNIIPIIQKHANVTQRRAKNIALDQTRKAYNAINKQRMQAVGVKQFVWMHSYGGQFPRESHIKINGHIFSFENLVEEQAALNVPVADRGLPGYPINCRCTMNPVIEFDDDED